MPKHPDEYYDSAEYYRSKANELLLTAESFKTPDVVGIAKVYAMLAAAREKTSETFPAYVEPDPQEVTAASAWEIGYQAGYAHRTGTYRSPGFPKPPNPYQVK